MVRINVNTEKDEKELRNKTKKDDDVESPKETDKIKLLNQTEEEIKPVNWQQKLQNLKETK